MGFTPEEAPSEFNIRKGLFFAWVTILAHVRAIQSALGLSIKMPVCPEKVTP